MAIRDKTIHDPVADFKVMDAYMRSALLASEEVVGERGMGIVLRQAGLEQAIGNYPPNSFDAGSGFTFGQYADLCAALLDFFGRPGKSMTLRIGRIAADHTYEQLDDRFKLSRLAAASKLLPAAAQLKASLMVSQKVLSDLGKEVGNPVALKLEDRGDRIAYIDNTCVCCAGKETDQPICHVLTGALDQNAQRMGRKFNVIQVACRAMGHPACVWEFEKKPAG
jgi:hypothetical protein